MVSTDVHSKWTVNLLKAECARFGLKKSGKKLDLVTRYFECKFDRGKAFPFLCKTIPVCSPLLVLMSHVCMSAREDISHELLLARAGLEPLRLHRLSLLATTVLKLTWEQPRGPDHLVSAYKAFCSLSPPNTSQMSLRGDDNTLLPRPRTEYLRHLPFYMALKFLLSLPASCKKSLSALKSHLSSLSLSDT